MPTRRPARRNWQDLTSRSRIALVAASAVQLGLLGAALTDLRRRDPAGVRGPRWAWALACGVNVVGPLAYFLLGRRRTPA